jgi:small subunit ribosomal protein S15Ae
LLWKHIVLTDTLRLLRRWHLLHFYYHQTGYIGEFEIIDDHRANKIVIELNGRLNKCGVISPRFDVEYGEIEKWIVNLLPSRQFGHIILSTTYGIMTHEEARRKKTGGKILGFFY